MHVPEEACLRPEVSRNPSEPSPPCTRSYIVVRQPLRLLRLIPKSSQCGLIQNDNLTQHSSQALLVMKSVMRILLLLVVLIGLQVALCQAKQQKINATDDHSAVDIDFPVQE